MGVTGTPESGNAIARQCERWGSRSSSGSTMRELRAQQGLPIPDAILVNESALTEPTTAKDPTAVVTAFLAKEDVWKPLHRASDATPALPRRNRHKDFELSRRLLTLCDRPSASRRARQASGVRQGSQGHGGDRRREGGGGSVVGLPLEAFDTRLRGVSDAFVQSYDEVRQAATAGSQCRPREPGIQECARRTPAKRWWQRCFGPGTRVPLPAAVVDVSRVTPRRGSQTESHDFRAGPRGVARATARTSRRRSRRSCSRHRRPMRRSMSGGRGSSLAGKRFASRG